MATSLHISSTETIGLAEFRRRVQLKVDPENPETLLNVADDIIALANNSDMLVESIKRDLGRWKEGQFGMYTPQSYLLDRFGKFTVRINLWKSASMPEAELAFFSYASYHNHDFPFLTTNYYGPGYRTSIYEANAPWRVAKPGDFIDMKFLEETDLPPGKVMYYRKNVDVHSQIPPVEDSASLNLMIDNQDDLERNQFYFDVKSRSIVGRVENTVAKRLTLLDLGYYLAEERSLAVLDEIARTTSCEATRKKAMEIMQVSRRDAAQ